MAKPIYIVSGSKGGVGKSIVSMALIDYLQQQGETVLLVEADTTNPDVYKAYKNELENERIDLDEADGWIDLVNLCDKKPDSVVVINTPARNNAGVKAYGQTLTNTLPQLKRKLVTLWVINRQRDSLELLKEYMESVNNGGIHILRNLHHGEERKFELFNGSKVREAVENQGGKALNFPDLADRVADEIHSNRLSITKANSEMPLGNRAELTRWRNQCGKLFAEVVGITPENLGQVYKAIYGHDPKPEDANRFNEIGRLLGLKNNDALWPIVFYLGYHLELADRIPGKISQSASETLEKFKAAAAMELEATKARTEAALTQAVASAANRVALATARRKQWQWAGIGLGIAALAVILAGWFGYSKGFESGYDKGFAENQDLKAAATWVNTEPGKLAYRFWKNGELERLANCDRPGWKIERSTQGKRICVVGPVPDGSGTIWWAPLR